MTFNKEREKNHWSTKPLSGLPCLLDSLYDNAELAKLLLIQVLMNVEMSITFLHTECERFFKSVLGRYTVAAVFPDLLLTCSVYALIN